jgi:hypothetical protein
MARQSHCLITPVFRIPGIHLQTFGRTPWAGGNCWDDYFQTLDIFFSKEFCLLEHNAMESLESQLAFRRTMSPWSSGKTSKATVNVASSLLPASCWFLAWLTLQPWRCRRHVPPKRRLTCNGLHGVISQNIETFIITAVRAPNPANCFLICLLLCVLCLLVIDQFFMIILYIGARSSVLGWGTVAGSIPDETIGFFILFNPSSRTMALRSVNL